MVPIWLDLYFIGVAIRTIAADLDALDRQMWPIVGHLLAAISASLYCSYRYSRSRVRSRVVPLYLFAVSVFVASSLAAALVSNMDLFIEFRVLQGLSIGCMTPLAASMIQTLLVADDKALYGLYGGTGVLASSILGPVLIVALPGSWRSAFVLYALLGAISFAIVLILGRSVTVGRKVRGGKFIVLRVLQNLMLAVIATLSMLLGALFYFGFTVIPQYLQIGRSLPLGSVGLLMLAAVVGLNAVQMPVYVASATRRRGLLVGGLLMVTASFGVLPRLGAEGSLTLVVLCIVLFGSGIGLAGVSWRLNVVDYVQAEDYDVATLTQTAHRIGGVIGVVTAMLMLPARVSADAAMEPLRTVFLVGGLIAVGALLVSLAVRRRRVPLPVGKPAGDELENAANRIDDGLTRLFTRLGPPSEDATAYDRERHNV
jgi:MFS family permease